MSRIVICDSRERLVTTLESILQHWGYRVLATNDPQRAAEFVCEIGTDLLLVGCDLLANSPRLQETLRTEAQNDLHATILIEHPAIETPPLADLDRLKVPFNIFELFAYVQKYLEKIPRRNLRLNISLPTLISLPQSDLLADVLSLSSHGLFVKTSLRSEPGQTFIMMLPLFGMKQEIEVPCRVIYTIQPSQENNYLQGFGVEFISPNSETLESLRQYLEKRLLEEIAAHPSRISQVEADQMETYTSPERLHLILKEIV